MTCLALLGATCLGGTPGVAAWQMDQFMVSAWGGPDDEAGAKAWRDAHFNTVMLNADKLDICRKAGLRVLVMNGTPEMAAQHTTDPAVWGWFVQDEPPPDQWENVAKTVAAYHAADPNHPAYVNLTAYNDLKRYVAVMKPEFISFDYYQWWWGPANECWRLEDHRQASLDSGLPVICWVESNADPLWEYGKPGAGYLPDNLPKLRSSVYLALAYGVKGIQWFTGGLAFDKPAAPGQPPKLTRAGEDIRVINAEIEGLGPTLLKLRSTGVFHTEPVPPHAKALPADLWVQLSGPSLTLGLFEDVAHVRYAMLVNRDLAHPQSAKLRFTAGTRRLARFDCQARRWVRIALAREAKGVRTASLTLEPGGGGLLRVR